MQNLKNLDELKDLVCDDDRKLDVLFLANLDYDAGCCSDYIKAIKDHSRHRVTVRNPMVKSKLDKLLMRPYQSLKKNGKSFDVIIIHYSICIISRNHISLIFRKQIRSFKGIKLVIIQDEYRWINKIMKEMVFLRINGIISLLNKQNINKVYNHPKLKNTLKVTALAGYVSQSWIGCKVPNTSKRKTHIIYRGNSLPFWLGNAAHEKSNLSQKVIENFEGKGLRLDVSSKPDDRIYGGDWMKFMFSGKCVIGLEGGASIFDFDGNIEKSVRSYLKITPDASYQSVHDEILNAHEDHIYYRMITPRSFEAICMKTVQVMYPGQFSGILEPWKHYIPLERDFSNLNDVISAIKDDDLLQEVAERAYDEIIKPMKYSERNLASGVDGCINFLSSQNLRKN